MSTTSFGRDMSCMTSIRSGRFVNGAWLVAESAFRRLTTPRGMLRGSEEEANFGLDLTSRAGGVTSSADAASLPGMIRAELLKDERIESVDVAVKTEKTGPATTYQITIYATTNDGPFSLQIQASDVTVELLSIQADG